MPDPSESHAEKNREYLASIASRAYEQVWRRFPEDLRPDPAKIPNASNIVIAPLSTLPRMQFHPCMKPDLRQENERNVAEFDKQIIQDKLTWYYNGVYTFAPRLFLLHERSIKSAVYAQIGSFMLFDSPPVLPDEYALETRVTIQQVLDMVLVEGHGVSVDDTQLEKQGFAWKLIAEGSSICPLFEQEQGYLPDEMYTLNDMFSLSFEFVTSEIVKRGGNMEALDYAVRNGILQPDPDNYPNFYSALFSVFRRVDWRILLSALRKFDADETHEVLQPYLGDATKKILTDLIRAIDQDVNNINNGNMSYYRSQKN